jgi:hypothetical protein
MNIPLSRRLRAMALQTPELWSIIELDSETSSALPNGYDCISIAQESIQSLYACASRRTRSAFLFSKWYWIAMEADSREMKGHAPGQRYIRPVHWAAVILIVVTNVCSRNVVEVEDQITAFTCASCMLILVKNCICCLYTSVCHAWKCYQSSPGMWKP